jgi:hypothetical protein
MSGISQFLRYKSNKKYFMWVNGGSSEEPVRLQPVLVIHLGHYADKEDTLSFACLLSWQ